ncbi:S8 family serine peptidase [Amycolatopsis jiangsuensis]|uniref:Subtilisin family serine protease n=1 Tax=Amycolatopsis jiangsuensis TaxID=1181879 RepID=A0A840IVZ9_9PSEU|nr:S8 family serine peptidase [Amycolatopsis jiangsuensis]MBB4685507.1 subtilisin family serine protease [Amycolatopsis jiangsuensis]
MSRTRLPGWAARSAVVGSAVVLAAAVVGVPSASAQSAPLADPVAPAKVDATGFQGKLSPRLSAAQGEVTAFVELAKKPAVDAFNAEQGKGKEKAKQAARAAKADVAAAVSSLVGQLRSADAGMKLVTQTANAVAGAVVTADAAKIRELAKRDDVVSVRTVVPKTRTNASAEQLTNTLASWQQTGKLGDNIRVGVIDDGIDYTHADFGGPGTPEAYESVDRTKPTPLFPSAKVVGGTDLVGDDYDSEGATGSATPKPDPNPIACGEHGTHVAGTVAGFGVNADGSTFTGDYRKLDKETLDAMRVGPGTAPKALLYAIKVFGCQGSTNVTSQALDWALDPDGDGDFTDHLDVVNLSLGSDFGAPDDPDSLFVRKLAQTGVVPVISAGNGGDINDIAGSPGNTPEALTVASSRDAGELKDAVEIKAPITGQQPGQYSQDYTGYDTLDLTAPVVSLSADNNAGCDAYSAEDKAKAAGKIIWLEWDDNDATRACGSAARANTAEAAGAKGVLLSSTLEHFAAGIAGNAAVPMFQLTGKATEAARPGLTAGTLNVRMFGDGRTVLQTYDQSIVDTPSSFTSRGGRGPSVKPDVSAPGDTITSAFRGSGNGRLVISGTSMAAPHTSGITALVRQAHPDWNVEEVKADVVGTAAHDIADGKGHTYAPQRVGAGRIDAKAALDNQVLAYVQDDPGAVSVTFGTVEATGPVTVSKTIKVVNKGVKPVEYSVGYEAVNSLPGVEYTVDKSSVKLSPRGVATVKVTLKIADPKALRKVMDPTMEATQAGLARQFVADASGRVALTPKNGATVPLRVAVYSAPKPVSAITTPTGVRFAAKADQAVLNLGGKGIDQGSGAQRYRSLISVLELQAESPQLPECDASVTSDCTLNRTAKGGDLRYVGAASTAPLAKTQGEPENATLAFGITTWSDFANLGSNTVPFVDIDTTGDGKPDFETFVTKATGTDVLLANTVSLNEPDFPSVDLQAVNGQLGDVDTNVFDSNVMVLPVSIAALGIDPKAASHRISYTVGTSGYYVAPGTTNGLIDSVSTPLSFDALAPAYSVQGGGDAALAYVAKPGTALVVNRNKAAVAGDKPKGLLALEHHNAAGARASVVRVESGVSRG